MRTLVIDPGHGKTDTGAIAIDGQQERYFTWDLSKALGDYIKANYYCKVIYTHEGPETALSPTGDLDDELKRRADKANGSRADLLLSLHHDSTGNPEVRGGSLFCWTNKRDPEGDLTWLAATGNHTDPKSLPIAGKLVGPVRSLLESFGIPWRAFRDPNGISCADFGVLRNTKGAALLLEVFHGSNAEDTLAARRPYFIPQVARTLGDALAKAMDLPALTPYPKGAIEFDGQPLPCGAQTINGKTVGQLREFGTRLLLAYNINPVGVIGYDSILKVMTVKTKPDD